MHSHSSSSVSTASTVQVVGTKVPADHVLNGGQARVLAYPDDAKSQSLHDSTRSAGLNPEKSQTLNKPEQGKLEFVCNVSLP